jgi:DNA-binding CsgD family transcriptional regulator/PAS domain-containing protein
VPRQIHGRKAEQMSKSASRNDAAPAMAALVHAIHAAGGSELGWPAVMEQLRASLGARVVTLGSHEFATGCGAALFEAPDDTGFGKAFAAFAARNPWFLSSGDYVAGRVITGEELINNNDLQRSDFYRGFLRPRDLLHHIVGVVAQREGRAFLLSAYRSETQGPFGARERSDLLFLLGHVTLSMESHWRWQESDELARALLRLLDHDSSPVILVTAGAEPIYRNPAADDLLGRRVGLCLDGTRLTAASPADQRMLREAIVTVAQGDVHGGAAPPRVVTLACAPPAPPVVAVVRAAGQVFMREAGTRRSLALITIRGGHARHDPAICPFARQYELTAAQAKVSALVFDGQSLATIARSLKVSENTVRSHLKQIYQKTNTHGQMDLVHLHARMCTALR